MKTIKQIADEIGIDPVLLRQRTERAKLWSKVTTVRTTGYGRRSVFAFDDETAEEVKRLCGYPVQDKRQTGAMSRRYIKEFEDGNYYKKDLQDG